MKKTKTKNCRWRNPFMQLAIIISMIVPSLSMAQVTISSWNYQPLNGTNANPTPNIGSGTSALVGSMTVPGAATGINTGTGCGAQVTGQTAWAIGTAAPGATNESSGAQWNVSTVGYENITFAWEQRWSGTATNTVRLQYTTNGSTWTNFTMTALNTTFCLGALDNGRFAANTTADQFRRITVDLSSITAANNNANFGVRIMAAHYQATGQFRQTATPATLATGGTWRFDNVFVRGTVLPVPTLTPSAATITGFNYTFGAGPSTSSSFTFSGVDLTGAPGNITVNAGATDYEVSTDNITFSPSVTYSYVAATLGAQTVHVRLKAGLAAATYNGQTITITGGGASSSINASGTVVPPTPVLTMSTAALTGFDYIFGFGPSASQSFTVNGSNLVPANSDVTVSTGVTAYEVSTDDINFFSSVLLPYTSGTLASTTVYIRLAASQAVGSYNLQAITATAGATNTSLNASGTVSPQIPLITVTALTPTNIFTTNNPTPSAIRTFTVAGQFLTDPLTISALAGYEYSSNGGFSWSSSLSFPAPTVLTTTISVRLVGTPAGSYSGTISVASLTATNSPTAIGVVGTVILVPTLTEVILPQYIQGLNGTNNDRLPYAYRVTINNLTPNATYRFFNSVVLPAEVGTSNGAGNPIFRNNGTWVRSTGGNLSSAGNYAEFDADGAGSYTGWFITEPTGNATRFIPGNNLHMNISLNDGAGGNTVVSRVTTANTVKVINFNTAAGPNNGTGIRSVSNGQAKDFIFLYDNDLGTGRPISGTYFENDATTGGTAYAGFYETAIDAQAKAWGTIIPNNLPNGIRYVASYSQATGAQLCTFSDDDGVWPTGNINTVNPTGFTTATAIVLNTTDVPMQCFLLPYVNLSANVTTGTEVGSTVITLTANLTGTIASPQTIDIDIAGLGITAGDYTLSTAAINFAAGANSTGTATFTIQNDLLFEGLETATISLINPSAGIELGFNTVVNIDIVDDEIPKIVINEIMYNNAGADEEWIELYNNDIVPITIDSTWNITGTPSSGAAWTRKFPGSTSILFAPGQFVTIRCGSNSAGVAFPFVPTLSLSTASDQLTNTGAPVILKIGTAIIDNVTYSPITFNPAANNNGPSLSLNSPSLDNSLAASWGACKIGGTPGLVNFNCDAPTFYSILSGDMNPEVWNGTTAIWSTSPTGTEGLIPTFTSTRNFVIQNGNTVRLNYVTTAPSTNNITVNNGGKLFTDVAVSGSEDYIRLFGNIINNGIIGNGTTYDAIGLSIEGINSTLSGTGSYNIGRIRKDLTTNLTSAVTINANVNLRFPGAAFYNNVATTTLNLTLNGGRTLTFTDPTGDLSLDGVDGTGSGDRNGNLTINGILNITDKLFASTNNTPAKSCNLTVGATGRVNVANIDANVDGTAGTLGAFSFTINAGGKINLTGKLKVLSGNLNSNGGLVIKSTATQTGLIDGSGAGNVTGDVLVERKIGTLSGYHFLSSPVQGAFVNNTVSGWRDDFTILSSVDNTPFIPGNIYTVIPTVFEYDETNLNPNPSYGYIGATGTTDAITPLKGFACVVPANTLIDVFGQVNNGPINYNVTKASDGINVIGNPYPSPINWASFRSHNTNLETTYKSFITTGGYNGSYGEYNSFTSLGTNGVGNIIASSQGFLVTAITAGAIQAINTDRTTDLNPTFFSQPAIVNDVLRLELVKDNRQDEILIFFAPSMATDNFDALTDAKKLLPFDTEHSFVYSIAGNDKLAMNGLGEFNIDKMIPLGIKVSSAGMHQIVATDLSSFAPSAMVYLYDAETGTVQNLRSNPSYSFNLPAGAHEGRFYIQFTPAVQLAVTATTCIGNGNDGKVNLTYNSTSTINVVVKNEIGNVIASIANFNGQQTINNLTAGNYEITYTYTNGYASVDYFTISAVTPVNMQASVSTSTAMIGENINFSSVNPTGATNWNFGDGVTAMGNDVNHIYNANGNYIVTATASNGECDQMIEISVNISSATGIENVNNQSTQWLISNNQITLKLAEAIAQNTAIELFDLSGKLVYSNTISKGQTQHNIPTAKFADGIYVAKLILNDNTVTKKISLRK